MMETAASYREVKIKTYGFDIKVRQCLCAITLDPAAFVESHNVIGGPAPKEVLRMIGERREELAEARERLDRRKVRLEDGDKLLNEAVPGMGAGVS